MQPGRDISRLIEIMAALRTPGTGCAWDLQQTFATIAPYTIEEAAEVADAVARGDREDLCEELGDLLLQVVFHAQMAEEEGAFAFPDVVEAITKKLIRRHPHVFGEARDLPAGQVKALWDQIKAGEKQERATRRALHMPRLAAPGLLHDVPAALPPLPRAMKLQDKAAGVGFDWGEVKPVLAKIREELDEFEAAMDAGAASQDGAGKIEQAEFGDILFALVNLARWRGIDPEMALRKTNLKFERRFGYIEQALAAKGSSPEQSTLEEMDALWNAAKRLEG